MKQMKVSANLQQDFTDAEKAQIRQNIGAAASSEIPSTVAVDRTSIDSRTYDVDAIHFRQKSAQTTQIVADSTDLGSTVPLPSLNSNEGKVPVAYYRDGRGYYLLEQYKDNRLPDSSSSDIGKVLTVNANGKAIWQTPTAGASNVGVYEFTVTKVLDGTGTQLWDGEGLTASNISESFVNCTAETCPVRITLDTYGRLMTGLRTGYDSITCESHTYVSPNANFATELGMWGYDDLCQVVAGMNRTWYLTHGTLLDQNGIRTTTNTLKNGTLTIKFDFVFEV